ncbi:MAG: translation initiation factor IF-2 subunit gamma [Candidatus Nanoarchaeia archaeon]|nr:translation initiation factor IF-2 subunit gamma [Candidatus Nanoarchaeia archaeon]
MNNKQPEINIGLVGHVDHGKTTLISKLSGKWTDTHSEELKKGITIKLGYANADVKYCDNCDLYFSQEKCPKCGFSGSLKRRISFVDAPGHESLIAIMLSGSAIFDGAIVLVAANEECPQPQTVEHVMALQIMGIKNVIFVQNKIDLVGKEGAVENYNKIKEFLKDTDYKDAPIIPMSAQHGANLDVLVKTIQEKIPTPKRDESKDPFFVIARSFDINRPGTKLDKMIGGILGGALLDGKLELNDEIEIAPGLIAKENNKFVNKPLKTKIIQIKSDKEELEHALPGGSIALLTTLDPSIVKADSLVGNIVGKVGKLPPVHNEVKLEVNIVERMIKYKNEKVEPIKKGEILMLNCNSTSTVGIVTKLEGKKIYCSLKLPLCANFNSKIAISRRIGAKFRLIGYGVLLE